MASDALTPNGERSNEEEQLADIEVPASDASPASQPDTETSQESADLDLQQKRAEVEKSQADVRRLKGIAEGLELHNKQFAINIQSREKFANTLFLLTCIWLCLIVAIVLVAGWKHCHLELSDAVLITLIGTTSINVLAFFRCVTAYLFPSDGDVKALDTTEKTSKDDK